MLELTEVQCRSLELSRMFLTWEATGTEDPLDYDIYVERADSPGGAWTTLTSVPLVDSYIFVDSQPGLLHTWNQLFYRLRAVHRASSETAYFPRVPVRLQARPPLDALEMSRQELVLLKEFTGRKCWLFKRRTFGLKCPECWDRFSQRKTKSNCRTCWSTGWMGGYHNPIEFYCQIDPTGQAAQIVPPVGETHQENTTARTIFFPPIDVRDLIVEAENKRWRVHTRSTTERARAPVKQELQIHRIPEGDMEYAIPLNLDILATEPTAVRQFQNPTVPGTVGAGLEGIFSRYGVD